MLLTTQMPLGYRKTFPKQINLDLIPLLIAKVNRFFRPRASAQNVVSGRYERNPFPVAS